MLLPFTSTIPSLSLLLLRFFLPFFFNSGCASIYEYLEKRFGPTTRSVISIIFLISQCLTSAAILYATALVLEFITGMPVVYAIIIITLIALVYTIMGGLAAVIWTRRYSGIYIIGRCTNYHCIANQ